MFMILMLAGDRMSCVWKGMRIRDLLGNALHVFCRLARKHVLRLIASSLSSTTLWPQPQLLGTSNTSPLIFAKVGVGGRRGVGNAGWSTWWVTAARALHPCPQGLPVNIVLSGGKRPIISPLLLYEEWLYSSMIFGDLCPDISSSFYMPCAPLWCP